MISCEIPSSLFPFLKSDPTNTCNKKERNPEGQSRSWKQTVCRKMPYVCVCTIEHMYTHTHV